MDAHPRPILLLVEFPRGFSVTADLLDTAHEIDLDGTICSLHFPSAGLDGGPDAFQRWPVEQPAVPGSEVFERQAADDETWGFWGKVHVSTDTGPLAAHIDRAVAVVLYEGDGSDDQEVRFADSVTTKLNRWLTLACEWSEVIALLDLRPDTPGSPERWHIHALGVTTTVDGGYRWVTTRLMNHAYVYGQHDGISARQWAVVLAKAAASESPAQPYLFLRDARASHLRREYRRATIDAATACEIALADSITSRLTDQGAEGEDIERALNRKGVVELFDLHAVVVGRAALKREHVMNLLGAPRNKAAHQGKTPTQDECLKAIQTASAVVYAAIGEPPEYGRAITPGGSMGMTWGLAPPSS